VKPIDSLCKHGIVDKPISYIALKVKVELGIRR
jgi:hypothetical protein